VLNPTVLNPIVEPNARIMRLDSSVVDPASLSAMEFSP
ncbi:unnamed protein product, partial [Acidithrix sp. C25]